MFLRSPPERLLQPVGRRSPDWLNPVVPGAFRDCVGQAGVALLPTMFRPKNSP